jgi:GT2 family glycosyltransferase
MTGPPFPDDSLGTTSPSGVAVVIITRNRCEELLGTLGRLRALPEAAEIVVVDNASEDGTADAVRAHFPDVRLIPLDRNTGAVGRTVGVRATSCPVVAFADDDSWWAPGALGTARRLFAEHADLGLVHARIVVEPAETVDPACLKMAAGPRDAGAPGPSVLGHLACGVVVRRSAYLGAGGYSPLLEFGGEEQLLSLDLAAAGWQQCYVDAVVAHHAPSAHREDWPARWARYQRNDTLTAWLRLPPLEALRQTGRLLVDAAREPTARRELTAFGRLLPAVLRERRPVPPEIAHRFAEATRA